MADLKENAYQIKFKLTPKKASLKGGFVSGIVIASTQVKAVEGATEGVKSAVSKEKFEVEVKLQSVVKLRKDFFFIVDDNKKQG